MAAAAPPQIFSPRRRDAARQRMTAMQNHPDAARFLAAEAADDLLERLAFLRHQPGRSLVMGDLDGVLRSGLSGEVDAHAHPPFPLEQPWESSGFDFIAALFVFDTANDLPGALIHMRRALAPGGLAVAVMAGSGSLPVLRAAMLAADGERPAPRLHPQVDVRAGGQLLQRAGYADPVVDSSTLKVRYGKLSSLVRDVRAQGLSNVLADPGPAIGRTGLQRAEAAFAGLADDEGRVTETFEILTLSGWKR